MLQLRTLGRLDLRADGRPVHSVLSQPRRAALLVYLAVAFPRSDHRRDTLLPLFWAERDSASARHALSQAVYSLRRAVGAHHVQTEGSEVVRLSPGALRCDIQELEDACATERWATAFRLYGGPFLLGFHVADAPGFDRWANAERERLRDLAAGAGWELAADQLRRGALRDSRRTAQRAVEMTPTAERPVREFVVALAEAGDRAAAVALYRSWAQSLRRELDLEPSPETVAAVQAIHDRSTPHRPRGPSRAG